MTYPQFYEKITHRFQYHPERIRLLSLTTKILTGIMYAAYPILLLFLWIQASDALLKTILLPAAAFLLLSAVRDKINRKRPYEVEDIHPLLHKDTCGHSMPSRHAFSSALIAMAWMQVSPAAGWIFLAVTVINGIARILGGIHYPSDVVIGILCGIAAGIPLIL